MNVDEELARARAVVRDRFAAQKRVLSFREYFELVSAHPARHTRDAARYLHDCFLHDGHTEVERPWGKVRRLPDGSMQMFVRDPAGNLLEISCAPDCPIEDRIFEDELSEAGPGLFKSGRDDGRGEARGLFWS